MIPSRISDRFATVVWEHHLAGERVLVPAEVLAALSCWDVWHVCFSAQAAPDVLFADAERLLAGALDAGETAGAVGALLGSDGVRWPESEDDFAGLRRWRTQARWLPPDDVELGTGDVCMALLKPGAYETVFPMMEAAFEVIDRRVVTMDYLAVRRLYPTAYGQRHLEQLQRYLCSAATTVLLLRAGRPVGSLQRFKAAVRERAHGAESLRNHVHLPASVGELYANLAQFFGVLQARKAQHEQRGGRDRRREALYRAAVGSRQPGDVVP